MKEMVTTLSERTRTAARGQGASLQSGIDGVLSNGGSGGNGGPSDAPHDMMDALGKALAPSSGALAAKHVDAVQAGDTANAPAMGATGNGNQRGANAKALAMGAERAKSGAERAGLNEHE